MCNISDIDSGCITLCVTSLFTLYMHFVIFVSWFLLAINKVCTPTLNKVNDNKYQQSNELNLYGLSHESHLSYLLFSNKIYHTPDECGPLSIRNTKDSFCRKQSLAFSCLQE